MASIPSISQSRFGPLARSMTNRYPIFASSQETNSLPNPYTFDTLANYEEAKRKAFGQSAYGQIMGARNNLAKSLTDYNIGLFRQYQPELLEDLNSRGLATSPSELANSTTRAMTELALASQPELMNIEMGATSADLQAQQDAIDSALDLRRGKLESDENAKMAAQEEALARDLAKQQSRNSLYQSLIGAGGNLGSAMLMSKMLGGGSLFGGGGAGGAGGGGLTAIPATSGTGVSSSVAPGLLADAGMADYGVAGATPAGFFGSMGPAAGTGALVGAGLGAMALSRAGQRAGGTAGGIFANPIGYQLNKAKQLVSNPKQTVSKAAKNVSKSIKKAFCFDGMTAVEMENGTVKPICDMNLEDQTKGGKVESIRISLTPDGTLYNYLGEKVTGSHAVKENGAWIRIKDSPYAKRLRGPGIVYSIVTSDHRIFVNGIEFADEHETDQYEHLDIDESLKELNRQTSPMGVN